jgi:hypothetical protein
MSEPKFTPGPWRQGGIFDPITGIRDRDKMKRPNTNIYGPLAKPEHQSGPCVAQHVALKDASLICAAPELYEALETLEREVSHVLRLRDNERHLKACQALMLARVVLAKARGES